MRIVIIAALFLCARAAFAQEQDRKLMDRLLKPDTSLTNSAQGKQFAFSRTTETKQVKMKPFYANTRNPEKQFVASKRFPVKHFTTEDSPDAYRAANLRTRVEPPKTAGYATRAYASRDSAFEQNKTITSPDYAGVRPFLIQGKSQKALSAQDKPLTIEEVRELLNKNK